MKKGKRNVKENERENTTFSLNLLLENISKMIFLRLCFGSKENIRKKIKRKCE